MPAAGRGSRPGPCGRSWRSPPRPPHRPPRPRTASAHQRRTGWPPPGRSTLPAAAAPSPPPGSAGAPTAAPSTRTGRRTARVGTAGPAPGPGTGTPTPPAGPPRTSGHRWWAVPGGAAGGRGSPQVLQAWRQGARSLPAQQINDESDTEHQPPRRSSYDRFCVWKKPVDGNRLAPGISPRR
jgi:hypothetical protein